MFYLAYDTNTKGAKKFIDFKTIQDAENYIKDNSDNEYFYEQIVTDAPKIYIDVDFGKTETATKYKYMEISEFDLFINGLIARICDLLNIDNEGVIIQTATVTINDVIYISSCHIIFKNHSMIKKQQKAFMKLLNSKYNYKLDDVVYKKNQLFRLVYMRKRGKQNRLNFYNNKVYSFNDCFLSNTKDTTLLYYDEPEIKTTTKAEKVNIIESNEPKNNIVFCSNISETFKKAISEIDFNKMDSKDWCLITKILMKYSYICDIGEWCKISTINTEHTTDANIKYCNDWKASGQIYNTLSGIPKLINILNKYLPYTIKQNYKLNLSELLKYIKTLSDGDNLDMDKLKESYTSQYNEILKLDYTQQRGKQLLYNGVIFTLSSGFLKYKQQPIFNFYYQYLIYQGGFIKDSLIYDMIYESIANIDIMDCILKNLELRPTHKKTHKTIIINASYGVGKTHFIIKNICDAVKDKFKMSIITPNNTFNAEATNKLNEYGFQKWISHTQKQTTDRADNLDNLNLICSLESIYKIQDRGDNDIIILDELTSLLSHLESDTITQNNKERTFNIFKDVLNNAKKIIVLDASISRDQIQFLNNLLDDKSNIKINITESKFNKYAHIIYSKEALFNNALLQDLKDNKNISICSNSKKQAEIYKNIIIRDEHTTNKNILLITGEKIQIIKVVDPENKTTSEILNIETKNEIRFNFLADLENKIKQYEINFFIYSPTVNMGVSINENIFHSLYCWYCKNSTNARQCLQMMYRLRNLKDKQINIFCSSGFGRPSQERDYTIYKNNILRAYEITKRDLNIDDSFFIDNKDYEDLRAINNKEISESNHNLIQQLHILLKAYDCKLSYKTDEEQRTISTTEQKKLLMIEKYNEYLTIENITHSEFRRIANKQTTDLTSDEIKQKNKFNQLINIRGYIENYDINDETTYNYKKRLSYGLYSDHNPFMNSFKFFETVIYKNDCATTYKNIINFVNYDIETDKATREISEYRADTTNTHLNNNVEYRAILKLIDIFKIQLNNYVTITNKDFKKLITENEEYFRNGFNDYIKMKYTKSEPPIFGSPKYIKWIYNNIKNIFITININLSYKDKNTTREGDKMTFQQEGIIKYDMTDEKFNNEGRYHRFNEDDKKQIYFFNPPNGTNKAKKISHSKKKMTFKTYKKEDLQKRAIKANDTGHKLYKTIYNNDLYKEYIPLLTKDILELSKMTNEPNKKNSLFRQINDERDIQFINYANEYLNDINYETTDTADDLDDEEDYKQIEIIKYNNRLRDTLGDDYKPNINKHSFISGLVDGIINNVVFTSLTNNLTREKRDHDQEEINLNVIKKHKIKCRFDKTPETVRDYEIMEE